jgi:c-di-GMP-binding flagellar brake protein YcgR
MTAFGTGSTRRYLRTQAVVRFDGNRSLLVQTLDISADGISVVAPENLQPGTVFEIRPRLPQKQGGITKIQSRATVAYTVLSSAVDGFKVGLRFVEISASTAAAIQSYLK